MSEKSEQTKKKLKYNADKIAIAALVLILLGLGYAWWQEQNSGLGAADTDGKAATFQDPLAGSPTLNMLQTMSANPQIAEDKSATRIAQYSMFDSTTAQQELAAENEALAKVAQAKTLIDQGQTDQARDLLKEALDVVRYNKEALQLLDSVTTESETAPDSGAMPPM